MNIVQNKTKPVPSWQQVENMEKGNYLVRYNSKVQFNSFCFSICNFGLWLEIISNKMIRVSVVQNVIEISCNTVGAKETECTLGCDFRNSSSTYSDALWFCSPKSNQNLPKSPYNFLESCIWDVFVTYRMLFFTGPPLKKFLCCPPPKSE